MEEVGEQCSDSTPKSLSSHHLWTADRKGGSENGDFQNGKKFSEVPCMVADAVVATGSARTQDAGMISVRITCLHAESLQTDSA